MSLLPSKPDVSPESEPRVVGVDSDEADDLMSALSSTTARRLVARLHEEPAPPAELAEHLDTTIQNVQYHLSNLEEAGVIEVVGTGYSEKGREMDVYAPADDPLVIFAGRRERASGLRTAVKRLLGAVVALAVGAVAVQETLGRSIVRSLGFGAGAGGADREGATGGDGGGGGEGLAVEETGNATAGSASPTDAATEAATGTQSGGTAVADATATATPAASPTPAATATPAVSPTPAATATPAPSPTPAATGTPVPETVTAAGGGGGLEAGLALPPGLLFLLGGLFVLSVAVVASRAG